MAPELASKSPVGIVADLPLQKKKASEIRAEKNNAIREEGNALFKAGSYVGAVAKYTECINSDPQDALSLANRAECYLRTRKFHAALSDADAARTADPTKPKSLYKRAMALNGLARYSDAVKSLKELIFAEPDDQAAKTGLAECEMLCQQAFSGDYNMPALLFGRLHMSFRRCADYVGPVAIVNIPEKGKGVVVTKDVKAGELICVSSPLAVAPLQTGAEMALLQSLVSTASRSPQDMAVINALPASNDIAKSEAQPAPDLSMFRKHLAKGDDSPSQQNLFNDESFARHCGEVVKVSAIRNATSVGVYPLPSFINHSCAPNACKLLIGQTLFIRAAKDLEKGEEITLKYFDVTSPEPERALQAKRFGIKTCACRRCVVERVGSGDALKATDLAAKKAKTARDTAVKDPVNKKPGMDRDGEKAASLAAAAVMDSITVNSPATLIAAMRGKAKASHSEITSALAEWKRTKGKSGAPDPNVLVELATWFDTKCEVLGLDATAANWARTSVLQVYANIAHCLSAAGLLEARGEMLGKLATTLAAGDAASFEHCKQLAVAVQNARRLGGAVAAKGILEAEKVAAKTLAVRYGCGGGEDEVEIVRELLKHLEHAAMENSGEFCEQ